MSKDTHTPGPWGYEASGGNDPDWEIAPAADIAESNWSREVAMTASGNEADARLIAAAPDLLAAAKAALHDRMYKDWPGIADLLIAAIAKAEGHE